MPAPPPSPSPLPGTAERSTPLGAWELRGNILSPTRCHLQAHARRLQAQSSTDPLITVLVTPPHPLEANNRLPPPTIHRSLIRAASPALSAIIPEDVRAPAHVTDLQDTFLLIRKFLYLEPIDLATAPVDLPLSAARWGLNQLFEACFAYAEPALPADMPQLLWKWMPVLKSVRVPFSFKTAFSLAFVAALDEHPLRRTWLSSTGGRGDYSQERDPDGNVALCDCAFPSRADSPPSPLQSPNDAQLMRASVNLRVRMVKPCQKRCNAHSVWSVFHAQGMLHEVITYILRYGSYDYGTLILDVLLRQVEPLLTDDDLGSMLRLIPWNCASSQVLASREALQWSSRAWQKLMLTHEHGRNFDLVRLPLLMPAMKSALPEPGLRAIRWESEPAVYDAFDAKLHFVLSVSCESRKSRRLPPMMASVRLVSGSTRQLSRMRVTMDAWCVSQCGCDIRGRTGALAGTRLDTMDELVVSNFAKFGGVVFRFMDGTELKEWLDVHMRTCSMRVVVHLGLEKERENPEVEDDANVKDRWLQSWQLKCPCGECHTHAKQKHVNGGEAVDRRL
eukprot:TRINITY_DN2272_c0_g1_i1.p1 TRINITY_DN2272_c0_g1~~TRINITY_DN2272_c0_g1_i1.p1  ORF type:complete len:562 (-),score=60.17 TRINITY_DN2272_c0_g1_i1:883-2568(-)